jgi:hypothetical protein
MEIPDINIRSTQINIRDISVQEIRDWTTTIPQAIPPTPPVVNELGIPIVDMPGCVESHETNNPSNSVVIEDDPKGSLTYCDAGVPSFNPINYTPEELDYTDPANIKNPSSPDESNTDTEAGVPPPPPSPPQNIECPNSKQKSEQPIGTIFDNGREIVVGYKVENGICIRLTESIPIPAQIVNAIPPAGIITTTASIALVATTSALIAKPFADILLKVVKPTIKKVVKKIATLRGKQPKVQSTGERIAEQRDRNEAIKSIRRVLKK